VNSITKRLGESKHCGNSSNKQNFSAALTSKIQLFLRKQIKGDEQTGICQLIFL
jgi:hypothetical protein